MRLDLYSEDNLKLHLLCKLLRSECEIKNTTAIPSSLTVTDTKQNINHFHVEACHCHPATEAHVQEDGLVQ